MGPSYYHGWKPLKHEMKQVLPPLIDLSRVFCHGYGKLTNANSEVLTAEKNKIKFLGISTTQTHTVNVLIFSCAHILKFP